jgi:hypothetical protein
MTIEVVHCMKCKESFVYIGRANPRHGFSGSPLCNPFHLLTESDRPKVIQDFKENLWSNIQMKTPMYYELLRLKELYLEQGILRLACWCAPKACHGDVVKSAILWLIK